ncbi:hypothetical protein SFR_4853 [Streptomyces sp. FR-008]|nr:hypothetical protein SFR_4853 [Streptomyces sp. FR-008]
MTSGGPRTAPPCHGASPRITVLTWRFDALS